jgi:hypothetical protein
MEEGTRVRFAEKPFRFGGTAFGRGSILALADGATAPIH